MISSRKKTSSRIGLIAIALAAAAISAPVRAQQDDATTAAFVAACKQAIPLGAPAGNWFGRAWSGGTVKILTLDQAVQARKKALSTGYDDLARSIWVVQDGIKNMHYLQTKGIGVGTAGEKNATIQEECGQRYIAFLQSIDAPSWEIARTALAQESAAVIAQQSQAVQAQQQAQEAAAAETARRQKEAAIAAAQAEVVATQRAAQQQADAETREKAESFAREAEKLPGCTDNHVLQMLKDAVAASPRGHALGLRVVDIENPRETGVGGSTPKRSCFAEMMTTAGRNWGPYTLSWASGGQDSVLIEVQLGQ